MNVRAATNIYVEIVCVSAFKGSCSSEACFRAYGKGAVIERLGVDWPLHLVKCMRGNDCAVFLE